MKKRTASSGDPEILVRLKALQPSSLYLITSKAFFLRGFEYYREERLKHFSWGKGKTQLKGVVLGNKPYTVIISKLGPGLKYGCDCPAWTASFQCKHVICSLLTLVNLISPNLFHQSVPNPDRLRTLKSTLLGMEEPPNIDTHPDAQDPTAVSAASPAAPPYEIVIESKSDFPAIYLRKEGRVVDIGIGLPEGLSVFTYRYYSDSALREHFESHLRRYGNRYPLKCVTDAGETPMTWHPKRVYQSSTELNISGDKIGIRACCLENGRIAEKTRRFWDYAVDLETGVLGKVKKTAGWRLYDEIDRRFRHSGLPCPNKPGDEWHAQRQWIVPNLHFQIPLRTFQDFQLNFPQENAEAIFKTLVLKHNDRVVAPDETRRRHGLMIETAEDGPLRIKAMCGTASLWGPTTYSTFKFFTELNDPRLPSPLKALKRQSTLCETFFKILSLSDREEAAKTIRKSLSNDDFPQYRIKSTARSLLKRAYADFLEKNVRLWAGPEGWQFAPNEKEKEAELYRIPFECFGPKILKDMPSYTEMTIEASILHERIPLLFAKLKEAGIDLYYHGKPVATAQWEFSFEATRASGIDWFEIKPEIRCDGRPVADNIWLDLLEQKGVVEKEGHIQIVDKNVQKILKSLSLIYQRSESEGRTKKEIVRVPSLQILDWIALRREGVRIRLSDADEALIEGLTQFEKIEPIATPRRLRAKLRPYQQEGLDWLAFLYKHRFGACLADDMGLGKTLQAISLIAALKEKIIPPTHQETSAPHLPHLIVVPPSLLFNWESEIERFYPDLSIHPYIGKDRTTDFKGADVVLTSYAIVRRDITHLQGIPFHVIILDEAQAVKNLYADTTGAVRRLRGVFKLAMTGTPLENHLGEYYSLIDICLPGLLGEYDAFKAQTKKEDSTLLQRFLERTRPFVLRRMKQTILAELPPKVETDIYLDLTPTQKRLYQKTVASIQTQIGEAYRNKTESQAKIIALTAILKLRQLCVSTRLIAGASAKQADHSPKMRFLIEQLEALLQEGHSTLVFSQFTSGLDLLEGDLQPTGIPYLRLDGATPTQKRKTLVKHFQEGRDASVFLLSLKAGGQGLNLTKASYVFHLDPWWNPAVENQASDRAHRIGQKNKVSITRLLMRHTIEEKMMFLKEKKRALYDTVMAGAEKGGRGQAISKADFDFLLGG